jgi:hypothetical protein
MICYAIDINCLSATFFCDLSTIMIEVYLAFQNIYINSIITIKHNSHIYVNIS